MMISEYMQNINNQFSSSIEKHVALQKINEALFVNTYTYFGFETTIYVLFYCVPLLLQMFYFEDPDQIKGCMMSCSIITGGLIIQEIIEFRQQKLMDFLASYSNVFNLVICFIFFQYSSLRLNHYLEVRISPFDNFGSLLKFEKPKISLEDQFKISILSTILLFGLASKLLEGFSVIPKFGRFVNLVSFVLSDEIFVFMMFLLFWVWIFAFVFQILDFEPEVDQQEQYKGLALQFRYFLYSWKQALSMSKYPKLQLW